MKRLLTILFILALLAISPIVAIAEYGEWEDLGGLDPPGYSNASFLNVSVADYDNLYTVGIYQPAMDRIVYGWKSSDAGASWDETVVMRYDGSICDMMKMMTFIVAVESMGADVGLYGGFGTSEDCYENLPEPWCMFICMLTLSPVIYFTEDGGETVEQAKVPFGFGKMVLAIDRAGDDVVFAAGGDQLIMKSTDKGRSWENIPNLPEPLISYSDIDFIDENVGYVVTGMAEPEPERTKDMTDEQWMMTLYQHRLNQARWLHDPQYRMERQLYYAEHGAPKGMNGKIFKTEDGGNSWEEILFSNNESFDYIQMINEEEGYVWASPLEGIHPSFRFYHTTDGGETWEEITDRLPLEEISGYAFGLMAMSFNPSGTTGFIGGAAQMAIAYKSLLFYTTDRGETWHHDATLMDWGHPIASFGWVDEKIAYQAGGDLATYRYTQSNVPPIADAGDDQEVTVNDMVVLDGSGSYDPDGDPITYAWEQLEGPDATLTGDDEVAPTFVATEVGEYIFQLVVDDGQETGHDEVTITAVDVPVDDDAFDDDTFEEDDDDNGDDDLDVDDDMGVDGDDDDDDDNSSCGC